ncbi:hypothetical protein [Pseudomonas fontis]|uniref:Uncharacterized protein n=1 Tax=Pseudomonas fontis TaxID=2942633 RepID=A0ABT5NTG5_9PSED|nr:hypothetical protein [Pseudomonas fontis]MDD0976882.1 hypothetical protein [Pseudomonas fontis]MDD0991469.1 hypothetical protein [Pseudomonas fontis]
MDAKLKHLEFVQGVVNRLSTNSFLLKGWSIILISALFALSAKDSDKGFALLAYIPGIAFWGLDGYFLALERCYRRLYDKVRATDKDKIDFIMVIDKGQGWKNWFNASCSKTLIAFHGAVFAAITAVVVVYLIKSCAA